MPYSVRAEGGSRGIELVSGGFPCQPHSVAGKRQASADDRDLWPEFARVIREIRPRWVVAENVPGLLHSESGRFFGPFSGTWPTWGIARDGACGELPTLERCTAANESSSWPTPAAEGAARSETAGGIGLHEGGTRLLAVRARRRHAASCGRRPQRTRMQPASRARRCSPCLGIILRCARADLAL
jgi:hypothetical protein